MFAMTQDERNRQMLQPNVMEQSQLHQLWIAKHQLLERAKLGQSIKLKECNMSTRTRTQLTFETAVPFYNKMRPFLGMALYSPSCVPDDKSAIPIPFHHEKGLGYSMYMEWMPTLVSGYRRPSYYEWCHWYGIEVKVQDTRIDT